MSSRSRARARARARLRASQTPTQPVEFGSSNPYLSQQYPEGAKSTLNIDGGEEVRNQNFVHPDMRSAAGITGGVLGGIAGGGNPLSVGGGYALGDLLYQKLHEGEKITPTNAAKRFGEGVAMEYLPKAALRGGGKLLAKMTPFKKIYGRAVGVPAEVLQKEADKITEVGLKHQLPISAKGIKSAKSKIASNSEEVKKIISSADENGVTIDIDSAVKRAEERLVKEWENVVGSSPDIKKIRKEAESILKEYGDIPRSYSKVGGYPKASREIPIGKAQKIKSDTQSVSTKEYSNLVRYGHKVDNPTKSRLRAMIAGELRNDIESKVPEIAPYNSESHDLLSWLGHATPRVRHAAVQPLVPTRLIAPAVIETMYKGSPQTATALAAASVVSSIANPVSNLALAAQRQSGKSMLGPLIDKAATGGKYLAGTQYYNNGQPIVSEDQYKDLYNKYMSVINYKNK